MVIAYVYCQCILLVASLNLVKYFLCLSYILSVIMYTLMQKVTDSTSNQVNQTDSSS